MSGGGALQVHHLQLSQSERIVWLLEELGLPYELHLHERDPQTALAPAGLKQLTPTGTAPFFRDTTANPPVTLFESGAIVEYILSVHAPRASGTKLSRGPQDKDYAQYLDWLHFANASLQANITRCMTLLFAGQIDQPFGERFKGKLDSQIKMMDDHLATNRWLAGNEISAADVMTVFSLTTMRGFFPVLDLGPFPNVLRYLKDVADRPAYRLAIKKGDNDMKPMIDAKEKTFTQFAAFAGALQKYA